MLPPVNIINKQFIIISFKTGETFAYKGNIFSIVSFEDKRKEFGINLETCDSFFTNLLDYNFSSNESMCIEFSINKFGIVSLNNAKVIEIGQDKSRAIVRLKVEVEELPEQRSSISVKCTTHKWGSSVLKKLAKYGTITY